MAHGAGPNGKPTPSRAYGHMPLCIFDRRVNLFELYKQLGRAVKDRDGGKHLRPLDIAVYSCLAAHSDRRGRCDPGRRRVASLVGASERQVSRALVRLKCAGLVDWQRRDMSTADPRHRTNRYHLPDVEDSHARTDGTLVSYQTNRQDTGVRTPVSYKHNDSPTKATKG